MGPFFVPVLCSEGPSMAVTCSAHAMSHVKVHHGPPPGHWNGRWRRGTTLKNLATSKNDYTGLWAVVACSEASNVLVNHTTPLICITYGRCTTHLNVSVDHFVVEQTYARTHNRSERLRRTPSLTGPFSSPQNSSAHAKERSSFVLSGRRCLSADGCALHRCRFIHMVFHPLLCLGTPHESLNMVPAENDDQGTKKKVVKGS